MFIYEFLLKQKPVDSNVGQWAVFIGIVIVTIGFLMAVIGSLGWFAHKLYTEYAPNWLNVAIALITLSGAVFFADELHNLGWNWFFASWVFKLSIFSWYYWMPVNTSNKKERPIYESYINYIFSYFYDCSCV